MLIGFQSDVYVVPNLQMINNGTIYLEDLKPRGARELGVSTTNNQSKKSKPVLQVEVLPSIDSSPADLQFVWNVTQEDSRSLNVQLYFEDPLKVSQHPVSPCHTNWRRSQTE